MARRAETIELAVLGLLHESPMHGYELRKRLNLMLGWGRVLSYGSLYPALKKMLRKHLIEEAAQTVTPVTRRPRIVYQLTPAGEREFTQLMSEVGPMAWEDDTFDVHFAFFARTEAEVRLRILEGRRSRLEERLANIRATSAKNRERLDAYTAELQRHGLDSAEREVRWLTELITAERSQPGLQAGTAPATAAATTKTTEEPTTP